MENALVDYTGLINDVYNWMIKYPLRLNSAWYLERPFTKTKYTINTVNVLSLASTILCETKISKSSHEFGFTHF